ncbi:putative transcription factor AS2-LOB family [Helianthus anomalus]
MSMSMFKKKTPEEPPEPFRRCTACETLRQECLNNCAYRHAFPPGKKKLEFQKIRDHKNLQQVHDALLTKSEVEQVDYIDSLLYEVNCRAKEPVGGCLTVMRHTADAIRESLSRDQDDAGGPSTGDDVMRD